MPSISLITNGLSGLDSRARINDTITEVNISKLPLTGGALTGRVDFAKSANIASGATVDLATATGNRVVVTGSTGPITSFGTVQAGTPMFVQFTGTPTITYNATTMILPTASDIIVEANDEAILVSDGGGNWVMTGYMRASGASLLLPKDFKDAANLGTAAALPANTRTANIITASGNGALTVDGTAVTVGMRILVKDESTGANNGLYVVTATGDGSNPFVLTRSSDADESVKVTSGMQVRVISGTANTLTIWVLTTADPITLNTTALTFTSAASETVIADTNIVYVDSLQGVDSAGRGQYTSKYATVAYALSDITISGTISCDTNTNTTIDNISDADNANLVRGQIITGTGIPYDTIIVEKGDEGGDANSITISKAATATASITATWWNWTLIKTSGPVKLTASIDTEGVGYDFGTSDVYFGAITAFNRSVARLTKEYVVGGNWHGTNASSLFFYAVSAPVSEHNAHFRLNSFYSIGTGIAFNCGATDRFENVHFECLDMDCRFGTMMVIDADQHSTVKISGYALLGGVTDNSRAYNHDLSINSPTTINVHTINGIGQFGYVSGFLRGAVSVTPSSCQALVYNAAIYTTAACTFTSTTLRPITIGSSIQTATASVVTTLSGDITMTGVVKSDITLTAGNVNILNFQGDDLIVNGSTKAKVNNMAVVTGTTQPDVTLNSTSQLIWEGMADLDPSAAGGALNVASGAKFTSKTICNFTLGTIVGEVNISGKAFFWNKSTALTGTIESNARIELKRNGVENSSTTPVIDIGAAGKFIQTGGEVICDHADSKSGLFRKSADTSVLVLKGQPYLKVANGLAPLQILSNTGTAQDVFDFTGIIDNCAVTFRLADTFTDTTYGTAYAPNLLIGGTHSELTTNTW